MKKTPAVHLSEVFGLYDQALIKVQGNVYVPELGSRADVETLRLAIKADLGISSQAIELVRLALEQANKGL